MQQITKNKLGSWRYILQLLPNGQASVVAMKFQFQFTECLHVLQLVACPTKTENYLASCIAAGCTHGVPCALLSATFTKPLHILQKICSQFQKANKKKPIWKEICCCGVSKRKTQQKKQNRECIFFLAKLAITYFCSSSLATC